LVGKYDFNMLNLMFVKRDNFLILSWRSRIWGFKPNLSPWFFQELGNKCSTKVNKAPQLKSFLAVEIVFLISFAIAQGLCQQAENVRYWPWFLTLDCKLHFQKSQSQALALTNMFTLCDSFAWVNNILYFLFNKFNLHNFWKWIM